MIPGGRDIKVFTGTMDKDTEARYLGANNYRHLLNARSSVNTEGSFGAIEDVMGNVLVSNPFLTNGKNKVIGSYEDIAGQSCIYFVWNELGFHGIYRWYANRIGFPNGVIEKIYQVATPSAYDEFNPNPLNFQENSLIVGVNLVEELLYWTDGFNDPKYINIKKANETGKSRQYKLYVNLNDLSLNVTYTINVYLNQVLVLNISVSSNQSTLEKRIADIYNQINASGLLIVENKSNYVLITMPLSGEYYLDILSNSPNTSQILPDNFYPDGNGIINYPPIDGYFFNQIKPPPFCAPLATYESTSINLFTGLYNNVFNSYNGNTFRAVYIVGFGSEINDVNNNITLGGNSVLLNANLPFSLPANSYVTNLFGTYSFTLNGTLSITNSQVGAYSFRLYFGKYANPLDFNLLQQIYFYTNNINTINNINANFNIANAQLADQYVLVLIVNSGSNPAQNISYNFSATLSGTIGNLTISTQNIARKGLLFRNKYIYDNFESSVYSAISYLPLPSDLISNDAISINYDDKWLGILTYLSEIKNIVLAFSDDNGTTWYDYKTLEPYQFANTSNRTYVFTNNEGGIAVDTAFALLQYSAIANIAKSQEYIDDRIWHGALTEGYDKIEIDVELNVKLDSLSNLQTIPYRSVYGFKYGYTGQIGIVYYDNYDRKSPVCYSESCNLNVPYYLNTTLNTNINSLNLVPSVDITINNTPPDWATKYQIVRTKDLFTSNYLIWQPRFVSFYDEDLNAASIANAYYIGIDVTNITFYVDNAFLGYSVNYTYTVGDRIRVVADYLGFTFSQVYDTEILSENNGMIYIKYDTSNPLSQQVPFVNSGQRCVIELYTPAKNYDTNIFYEIGECYDIGEINVGGNLIKYHKGNVSDQDVVNNTPAIINTNKGGVYYRYNNFPIASAPAPAPINQSSIFFISSQKPNEYLLNAYDALGRTNSIELIGRKFYPTAIRFSDKYISNTEINSLAIMQPLNTRQYSTVYGPINKLQVVNNDVLKLIFGNSYQLSIYVSQGVIRQTQGAGNLISLSDEVAGNSHIIQRTLGTINGESVVVNDEGDMFGYDENEGVVWIASGNGLIQISDRGMKSVFKRYSNERKAVGGVSHTPAVYDLYHDEYIITLGRVVAGEDSLNVFEGVTIAYNKQKQGWTSYYSFVPEYYGRVRDYIVSFKDGELWKHDASPIAKNFYGAQYPRELTYVSNKDFPKVKDYKAISVNGIGLNSAPRIAIPPFQGYPQGMLSSLSERFFKVLEGIQYSNFQKDSLTPGFGGNLLRALANGRNLKGQTIEVTLRNTDTAKSSIYSSDIVYFYSEHS